MKEEEEEEEEARARRLLSFSFTWSDRSSISKGRQIETEKDAIEVADRAPSSRKRAQTYRRIKRNVVVLGKPLMRRVAIKVVQNETRNSFVQSSSRVFETKKKDRRNAPPPTRTLSVLLVLKSDRAFKKTSMLVYIRNGDAIFYVDDDDDSINVNKKTKNERHVISFDSSSSSIFF